MLLLLIFSTTPVFAATTAYLTPTPTSTTVYSGNTWSSSVTWDCTNIGIPSNAVVVSTKVRWVVTGGYLHMNLALFNQSDSCYVQFNDLPFTYFAGQPAAQKWTTKFWIESLSGSSVKVTPQLQITYQ